MIKHNVIPAPYPVVGSNRQVRGKLQRGTRRRPRKGGEPVFKRPDLDSPASSAGQAPRRQGPIKDRVPGLTGNPGFLVKPGMTEQGECLYNYGLISNVIGDLLKRLNGFNS